MISPELAVIEAMFKDGLRRVMAEDDPEDIRQWASATLARLGGGDTSAVMTWPQSFDFTDAMLAEYARQAAIPEAQRKILSWPWSSWASRIEPLEPGMLAVITAPDGQGKTIYSEVLDEHWAKHKNRVVFVHYELNRKLMMLRRLARHTSITVRDLKAGILPPESVNRIAAVRPGLVSWDGYISYVHTPGWSMERTCAELHRLHAEGECDVIVLDYLEKAQPSPRQAKLHMDWYQRETDNVEQIKTLAESTGIPVLMVAQMSKAGKGQGTNTVDRNAMTGSGEKSNRANLVVLLRRDRDDLAGYSSIVDVIIDKNTMGGTSTFQQQMQPQYYRVGDIA